MREILLRGKSLTGGWMYGAIAKLLDWKGDQCTYIIPQDTNGTNIIRDSEEVDPATVGQYTGLTDKNGVKIFEGDIVRFKHGGEFGPKGIYFRNYAVEFINTYATYGLRLRNKSIHFPFKQSTACMHDVVVIGNIHDNPELIEGVV